MNASPDNQSGTQPAKTTGALKNDALKDNTAATNAGPRDADHNLQLMHLHQQILQLADNINRIQNEVASLTARLQQDSIQINALVRHLTDTQSTQLLQERLADFGEQMNADHEQLNYLAGELSHLATQEQLVRLATQVATQEKVTELTTAVEQLGRTQQRANLLAATKEQQLESALATLQEILSKREKLEMQNQARAEEEVQAIRQAARGEVVGAILPALDMLETLLAQGKTLAEKRQAEYRAITTTATGSESSNASASSSASLFSKWRARMGGEVDSETAGLLRRLPESMQDGLRELDDWLRKIALLHDRLIGILRHENIEPIIAVQQLFDPHLHLAVDSEARSDVAPQTIIREIRKGYRQGARTLRHSEVVVAHRPGPAKTADRNLR